MTRMTEKSEYSYSIQNLQDALREVMVGEYTPQEIHEVILDTIRDNMRYYRACYNDSVRLLALLKINSNEEWRRIEDPFYEKELSEIIQNLNNNKFKLDSPELHNEDED